MVRRSKYPLLLSLYCGGSYAQRPRPGKFINSFSITGGSCHKYNFCRDKHFVATNTSFVATKVCLSRQNICSDKIMFCLDKHTFVATNICREKSFVATKIILVAAPANDTFPCPTAKEWCMDEQTLTGLTRLCCTV